MTDFPPKPLLTNIGLVRIRTYKILDYYETDITGGPHNNKSKRATTWDQAEKNHDEMVELVWKDMRESLR